MSFWKKYTFYSNKTNLQPFLPKAQGVQDMAEFKTMNRYYKYPEIMVNFCLHVNINIYCRTKKKYYFLFNDNFISMNIKILLFRQEQNTGSLHLYIHCIYVRAPQWPVWLKSHYLKTPNRRDLKMSELIWLVKKNNVLLHDHSRHLLKPSCNT